MTYHKESTILQRSVNQIVAGGSAGLVEICIMHPLDIVKTRLQIQRGGGVTPTYTSLTDCVGKLIKHEGLMSLYKGILPPILAETPRRVTKFWSFERYKSVCSLMHFTGPWSPVVAGIASGATEGLVLAPFERVKVYMQVQRAQVSQMPSTWEVTRSIVRRDGWGRRGLLRGLTALLARESVFNAVYFGGYYNMKLHFVPPERQESISLRLLLGFTAGFLAGLVNIPFDVAKSRIQGPQPYPDKYLSTLSTIRTVWREEGFLALGRGLAPRLLRLGPGGAIMLVVYEQVLKHLEYE